MLSRLTSGRRTSGIIRMVSSFSETLKNPELLKNLGFINGEWVESQDKKCFQVLDPGSGEIIGSVPAMKRPDVEKAIKAASAAFKEWKNTTAKQRSAVLRNMASLMQANLEDLARILTKECGKPLAEARGEIAYAISFYDFFAEEAKRAYGDVIPHTAPGRRMLTIRQPVGVCGLVTPWNFPSAMITRKVGPAIAAGCTVVVKPAEATPFSALALCEIAQQAGLPKGVLNIVPTDRPDVLSVGETLCRSPDIRKISFTGSTAVGKWIMSEAAGTVKRVSLELGGNAPFIVFEDADLEAALKAVILSKFRNAGQTCICTNRILVQNSVYDKFVDMLKNRIQKIRVGHGLTQPDANEPPVDMGPLINKSGLDKVIGHVKDAVDKGGRLLVGGKKHSIGANYYEPTLIADMTTDMRVFREETFGPLAAVMKFSTEEEAVLLANDTKAGLAAYVATRDLGRSWRVSENLEYGMVGVNEGLISSEMAPFGGVKESGIGREGSHHGLDEFTSVKYMCFAGI